MRAVFGVVLSFLTIMLAALMPAAASNHDEKTIVRVALYEFIPGYDIDQLQALRVSIKQGFEQAHPQYELDIKLTPNRFDLYDLEKLERWLTDETADGYDVLEIDTLLLGELVNTGAISPWVDVDEDQFFSAALDASRVNGRFYGIPHLMCGYFLFTRDAQVAEAETVSELVAAARGENNDTVDLVGAFEGSWTIPSLYLDARVDTAPQAAPNVLWEETVAALDPETTSSLRTLFKLCDANGLNACLREERYALTNASGFSGLFAMGFADSLIGYSERFHFIKKMPGWETVKVGSAPLGDGNAPLMFADSFVLSERCNRTAQCRDGARAFADYMNQDDVLEPYLLARDLKDAWGSPLPPRYLLPAKRSAYGFQAIKSDPIYSGFEQAQQRAVAFPNTGFGPNRKAVRDAILCEMFTQSCSNVD
ncbi:MAG: extracellular solute-binding protein [Pseudomonadota bacterium]